MKRKSKVWAVDRDELAKLVANSTTLSSVLKALGLTTKGTSNFHSLKKRLEEDNIDYHHIKLGLDSNKGRKFPSSKKIPLEKILVENSSYSRDALKIRLVKEGLLDYKCSECGLIEWNGKPLSLQLDHKNGVHNDNRLFNLRFLCPNCHSQTKNFAGKASRKRVKLKVVNVRKNKRPLRIDLEMLLWKVPTVKIADMYGVTDKAVEKWVKYYGLTKPPRGYWSSSQSSVVVSHANL